MIDIPEEKRPHRLDDHFLGVDPARSHEEGQDDDHDHDDLDGEVDPVSSSMWLQDNITLLSVGIDIGSAGTQVIFSRVQLRRFSEEFTSRYFVVGRETMYQSPVALTPYLSDERIDDQAIGRIIDSAYEAAGIHPDNVDTGAVILTGEALRRENAKAIADVLAEVGGEFVCAAAGHHMESMLAAYGSGAAKVSHDHLSPLLNIDIGGGTTKLALVEAGNIVRTAAIQLGGRLVVIDGEWRLARLDPAGGRLAALAGCGWDLGKKVSEHDIERVAAWMADALVAVLTQDPAPPQIQGLWLTDPLGATSGVKGVMFSGGVGEYVYGREERDFGDLGRRFGRAIRPTSGGRAFPVSAAPCGRVHPRHGDRRLGVQRAVVGKHGLHLESRGAPAAPESAGHPAVRDAGRHDRSLGGRNRHSAPPFAASMSSKGDTELALAFCWRGAPAHRRLAAFARGIVEALPLTLAAGKPLFVILDADIAQTLGALLKEELGVASEVLVLDGIALWNFDYIDLGRVRMPSFTVPVTIKSLVFSQDPRVPHHHQAHDHHHDHSHE